VTAFRNDPPESAPGGPVTTPRGTRTTPEDTTSDTYLAEPTHREGMTAELMELSVWLSEHPKEMRRRLKQMRHTVVLDPGVYYNAGIRMIERLYRPQHASLGNRMYRVSTDPAAPVHEIRRKVLEGK